MFLQSCNEAETGVCAANGRGTGPSLLAAPTSAEAATAKAPPATPEATSTAAEPAPPRMHVHCQPTPSKANILLLPKAQHSTLRCFQMVVISQHVSKLLESLSPPATAAPAAAESAAAAEAAATPHAQATAASASPTKPATWQ